MGLRAVRLSPAAERALERVVRTTGLSISSALTEGILALSDKLSRHTAEYPYEIYARLDLGPGGCAIAPSTDCRRSVRQAIGRNLRRQP
jgi:hypothetical protein